MSELFDMLLFPTYCPKYTDYALSAKLSFSGLVEIGGTLPEASCDKTLAKAVAGTHTALGGDGTITQTDGAGNNSKTIGRKTWSYSCAFANGTQTVKDSKGNMTNQTASNTTTLVGSGSTSNTVNIGTSEEPNYVLKGATKNASVSCEVVYPYYYPNASGAETKLNLQTANSFTISYSANAAGVQVYAVLPTSFTNVSITQRNVAGAYDDTDKCTIANGKLKTDGTTDKVFGPADDVANQVTVSYTKYRFTTNDLAGDAGYKIDFTIA